MSALLEPWKDKPPSEADMRMLRGDSQLIVVAGSDSTSATLTHIIYELCRNPSHIARLREEMLALRNNHDDALGDIPHKHLQYLEHLNGVIYETLRLHPPVPTALQRLTPPEGLDIAGTYIPGNTTVWCPQYALGRSEKAYVHAEAFMPERWRSAPSGDELIREKSAWAPFSAGSYACIGRPLALMNIRTTIARLVMGFDFEFAPGEEGKGVEEDSKDHFTLAAGELRVVFRKRK
jgi:cytochrome P450